MSLRRSAATVVAAVVLLSTPAAAQPHLQDVLTRAALAPRVVGATPTLDITLGQAALSPGRTLTAGVTLANPGAGPLVDVYFLIVLPDGTTAVSTGPGVGARFGSLANLRTLVAVARSVSLASAFQYQNAGFFTYTFTGVEPQGTYTVYFVTFAAGALNDGAIGAGEVVAFTSRTFVVGPSGAPQTDTSRTVAATIAPAGGSVQTSTAAGIGLRLAVPAGGLNTATAITIAPLTAFNDLPGGPLVAGVRAEPSGLRFNTPATLTLTLPAGFQAPPFGLAGFVADTDGGNLQRVPVSLVGNVATIRVPHFSVAGVFDDGNAFLDINCGRAQTVEHLAACAQMIPLTRDERARLQTQGGALSPAFKSALTSILRTWLQSGILPRLLAAQRPVADDDAITVVSEELEEWSHRYEVMFPIRYLTNAQVPGQQLGSLLDQAQNEYVRALSAHMDFLNRLCLGDKAAVGSYVEDVNNLFNSWAFMFTDDVPEPFVLTYCVDIDIQAAPLPVLTIGMPALMPLDIRLGFTDGTELTGTPLAVTISATNATVSPAGGIVTTPFRATVTVTPSATVGTITIRAQVTVPGQGTDGLNRLPVRAVTFPTGADLTFTNATLSASVNVDDTFVNIGPDPPGVGSSVSGFVSPATTNANDSVIRRYPVGGYQGDGAAAVTRTVTRPPGALVVAYAGTATASIAGVGAPVREAATVRSAVGDRYLATLPVTFDVVSPSCSGLIILFPLDGRGAIALLDGVTERLTAGAYQVQYQDGTSLERALFEGTTSGVPSATLACSLEFRAAP